MKKLFFAVALLLSVPLCAMDWDERETETETATTVETRLFELRQENYQTGIKYTLNELLNKYTRNVVLDDSELYTCFTNPSIGKNGQLEGKWLIKKTEKIINYYYCVDKPGELEDGQEAVIILYSDPPTDVHRRTLKRVDGKYFIFKTGWDGIFYCK